MRFNVLLWIVQGLLALLFLFAGGLKRRVLAASVAYGRRELTPSFGSSHVKAMAA